jgi:transposase
MGPSLEVATRRTDIVLLDHIMEVDHQSQRIERLEAAIDRAVQAAPAHPKAIVDALQSLRGVAKITAITLATEFGTFRRFEHASEVMSYTGLVPSERSSGSKRRIGAITKTGNSHLRRVLVESAWLPPSSPRLGPASLCRCRAALAARQAVRRSSDRLHRAARGELERRARWWVA